MIWTENLEACCIRVDPWPSVVDESCRYRDMSDLFAQSPPPPKQRKVYRVAEITRLIKTTLENEIGNVWVEGEISNFLLHSSGHMYFSLKDTEGLIKAAMFRGSQRGLAIKPGNGISVRAYGRISAYPLRS